MKKIDEIEARGKREELVFVVIDFLITAVVTLWILIRFYWS